MDPHVSRPAQEARPGRVIALSRDLFFGMRVRTILGQLGYQLALVNSEARVIEESDSDVASIVIVDFNQPVDWDALHLVLSGETPVLAFGSHTDVDGFRAAKAAGVTRVVSNGEFSRRLPELVEQYRSD